MNVEISKDGKELTIKLAVVPYIKEGVNQKGIKTVSKVISSSHGNQDIPLTIDGKAEVVKVGVNAFIRIK